MKTIDPSLEQQPMARWRGVYAGNRKAVMNVQWPSPVAVSQRGLVEDPELDYRWQESLHDQYAESAEHGFDNVPCVKFDFAGMAYLLANAFGAPLVNLDDGKVVAHARFETLAESADFAAPTRPEEEGLYPEIRRRMREFQRRHGPVRMLMPDTQSPMDVVTSLVKTEEIMMGCFDAPEAVHRLLTAITDAIIRLGGVLAATAPRFGGHCNCHYQPFGIHLSDDDAAFLSPAVYREFCIPQMNRLSGVFGGISLHCCQGYPQNVPCMPEIDGFIISDPQVDFNPVDDTITALEGKAWHLYNHGWQRKAERKAVFPDMEMLKDSIDRAAGRVGLVIDIFGNSRDDAFRIGDEVKAHLAARGLD